MTEASVQRGLIPATPLQIASAPRYISKFIQQQVPESFLAYPNQVSYWGNDQYGNCVAAEEAFAKITAHPYIYIDDSTITDWCTVHNFLNGAQCVKVMDKMKSHGIELTNGYVYDGDHSRVSASHQYLQFASISDSASLREAIFSSGPVKVEVNANMFLVDNKTGFVTPGKSGWALYGYPKLTSANHAVGICGYGTLNELVKLFQDKGCTVDIPGGMPETKCYAMFTWKSIGIVDEQSLLNMFYAAWVRSPVTSTSFFRKTRAFQLRNEGGFVCDIHALYRNPNQPEWSEAENRQDFPVGQSRTMSLDSIAGLSEGDYVKMKVWVAAGTDNIVETIFLYAKDAETVRFKISGGIHHNAVQEVT